MSDKGSTSDRSDVVFLIAALSLVAGVPAALYTIYIFAESIELVATLALFAILIVCISGALIVRYRDRIIDYIFKVPKDIAESFAGDKCEHKADVCVVGTNNDGSPKSYCANGGVCRKSVGNNNEE